MVRIFVAFSEKLNFTLSKQTLTFYALKIMPVTKLSEYDTGMENFDNLRTENY